MIMNRIKIYKRVFAIIILFILLSFMNIFSFGIAKAQPKNSVMLEKAVEQEDGKLILNINLQENNGLVILSFTLNYPKTSLTYLGYEKGEALSKMTFTPPGKESPTSYPKFLWDNLNTDSNDISKGTILKLKFKINNARALNIDILDIDAQTFDKTYSKVDIAVTNYYQPATLELENNNDTNLILIASGIVIIILIVVFVVKTIRKRKRKRKQTEPKTKNN